jgi:hypothetical protein
MPTAPGDRIRNFDLTFWIEKSEKVQQIDADSAKHVLRDDKPTTHTKEVLVSTGEHSNHEVRSLSSLAFFSFSM